MKNLPAARRFAIFIISLMYILLFVYAAVSKLLDFENFQVQVGQSPLLSAFAGWVTWVVPVIEILLALLLLFPRFRVLGLLGSFMLMVMFTTYIFIILHYSTFVPCSCGGILEKMNWNDHLIFNAVFTLLAAIALLLVVTGDDPPLYLDTKGNLAFIAGILSIAGIAVVTLLYLKSEQIIHKDNNFVRRFTNGKALPSGKLNLGFNSYYFAGYADGLIYLGNTSTPLKLVVLDTALHRKGSYTIALDDYQLPFRNVRVQVAPPYFYVSDGTVPCIFRGHVSDWKARQLKQPSAYFSAFQPQDAASFVFRGKDTNNESILGTFNYGDSVKTKYGKGLLQKQIDGVFDCDGQLLYSDSLRQLVYVYYYRNSFVTANKSLELAYRGKTIDTTTHAKLKIVKVARSGLNKLGAPPYIVNNQATVSNRTLFINSNLKGRFEADAVWKQAAVIDVYDLTEKSYEYSFYLYHVNAPKPHDLLATPSHFFGLTGNDIVSYRLK